MLKEEIENERRKSTADQGLIRKLQKLVDEKSRQTEEDKRRQTSLESEIKAIQEELARERNKSLADEATIKKLEDLLRKKVQELDRKQN